SRRSNSFAANCSRSPFFTPAQPASATVMTSWSRNSLRRARGTHSSSNMRIGDQVGLRLLEGSYSNLSCDGRKIVKKLIQRVAAFDVIDKRLHRNTSANKYRRATQDVRVGANDG